MPHVLEILLLGLVGGLLDSDPDVRAGAMRECVELSEEEWVAQREQLRPALIAILGGSVPALRAEAARTLCACDGEHASRVVLESAAKETNYRVQYDKVKALATLGDGIVPGLLAKIDRPGPREREMSYMTLQIVCRTPTRGIVQLLTNERGTVRHLAEQGLAGAGAAAAPVLIGTWRAAEPDLRRAIRGMLGTLGAAALPALGSLREDKDTPLRRLAIEVISKEGGVADLRPWAADAEHAIRVSVVHALRRFENEPDEVVPILLGMLGDPDSAVRVAVVNALGLFPGDPKRTVLAVAPLLRGTIPALRAAAGRTLAALGPEGHTVLALELDDPTDVEARRFAAAALAHGGKAIRPLVKRALKDPDERVRAAAVKALRWDEGDVPLLAQALKDSSERVKRTALGSLSKHGPAGASLAERVALCVGDDALRDPALQALAAFGKAGLPGLLDAMPSLHPKQCKRVLAWGTENGISAAVLPFLGDEKAHRRRCAAWILGELGSAKEPGVVAALTKTVDDRDLSVVSQVIWALGRLGPDARDALPALRRVWEEHPGLRGVLREAIERIEG